MVEMGEYLVGAYLRIVLNCDFVIYDQRISKQREIDVVGLDPKKNVAHICEVATHLEGLNYGQGNEDTIRRLREKFEAYDQYGRGYLPNMNRKYMLWSPSVPRGYLTEKLEELRSGLGLDLEFVINEDYTTKVDKLRAMAKRETKDRGEPFYRALQILEHLKYSLGGSKGSRPDACLRSSGGR